MARIEQRAATRAHILEAAQRLYARTGICSTRSADVAAEAGVAHGTVFLHFPTQEELLVSAIEAFGLRVAERLHELASKGSGLQSVLEAHVRGLAEHEAFYARLVEESPALPDGARAALVMIQSTLSHHFEQAAEADRAAGRIRDLPLHLVFNTWVALLHHYLVNRELFAPGGSVLERRGTELIDFFISLIGVGAEGRGERE